MTDFLIKYPDDATLDAVAQQISGLWVPAYTDANGITIPGHVGDVRGMPGIGEWAMTQPFRWFKPTGETTIDLLSGDTIPIMANDGFWYRVFRWNASLDDLAPYVTLGGATIDVNQETGVISIIVGPISMVSPLPADCPVSF